MGTERKPPQSAEELLERYSAGERDFGGASLANANLERASLQGVDLRRAVFSYARLEGANLQGADLRGANFQGAWFGQANFRDADLRESVLDDSNGIPADITGCKIALGNRWVGRWTIEKLLLWHRLGAVITDPETLPPDDRSILGLPNAPAPSKGTSVMLQSTFLSYGGPDTDFAQQLNDALLKNGVTTFFFAKDAIPGRKLHRLMREGVNQHDRVILVCSKASLDRPGVLNEIGETLQREARDGYKEYLIPITLDDYVFSGWKPEDPGVAQAIRDRVVADFKGAEVNPAKFNEGLLRLIAALKK